MTKIKDIIGKKITNIDDKEMLNEQLEDYEQDLAIGDNYVFYLNEFNGCICLDEVKCFYGTEIIVLFNTKTNKYVEEFTR